MSGAIAYILAKLAIVFVAYLVAGFMGWLPRD
jgi:hypothetical protein